MRSVLKRCSLVLMLTATPAAAHSWYPISCCSGMDCAPVTNAASAPGGVLVLSSKHGTVAIPANFPRQESQDSRMHVCMRPGPDGKMQPICVFLPPMY